MTIIKHFINSEIQPIAPGTAVFMVLSSWHCHCESLTTATARVRDAKKEYKYILNIVFKMVISTKCLCFIINLIRTPAVK